MDDEKAEPREDEETDEDEYVVLRLGVINRVPKVTIRDGKPLPSPPV